MDNEEKEQRIYYQNIVYAVCNALDIIDNKKIGEGIVCGTLLTPTTKVQDRMERLVFEHKQLINDILQLRVMLAYAVTGKDLYAEDGELHDASEFPFINFLNDSPGEILSKMDKRLELRMQKATKEVG